MNAGHEPRAIAEALVRHLRDGFLSLMAPELVQLSGRQVDELAAQAQQVGPAALVRGIERLGEILVELRHAPDPRVLVEVALVQLTTAPPADGDDIGALAGRLAKLEQAVAEVRRARAPPPGRSGDRARRPRRPGPPGDGRSVVRYRCHRSRARPAVVEDAALPDAGALDLETACKEWDEVVRPTLKGLVRALYTPVDVVDVGGSTVTMTTPNETHRAKCEQHRAAVQGGLGGGDRADR